MAPMAPPSAVFSLEGETLPPDAAAVRYEAVEAISEPFVIDIELSTRDGSFRVDDCLRTRLCLAVIDPSGGARFFDGIALAGDVELGAKADESVAFSIDHRCKLQVLAHGRHPSANSCVGGPKWRVLTSPEG